MKHLSILSIVLGALLLTSCASTFTHATYYIDYKDAGQGKLFITESNSVSFDYEPLGSILVEEIPGAVKVSVPISDKERRNHDDLYTSSSKTVTSYSQATAQTALNYAAQKCIEIGGDGLINVKLNSYMDDHKRRVVQVSGMVIKRNSTKI